MSKEECYRVLVGAKLARLACAKKNQPYVVPVFLVCHEVSECLYGFTTPGQKIEWMRANPLVCVEVDEVKAFDQWVSVIAFGRYEELQETPGNSDPRLRTAESRTRDGEAVPPWTADDLHRQFDVCGCDHGREQAMQVLNTHMRWWEPGCTAWASRAHSEPAATYIPIYYRIRIDRITGHEANPATNGTLPHAIPVTPAQK